ncbi:kinase-like domain-containing protein [Xylaria telfairii]|nr:kinase-like domain-containing protein [Xylaria telfairii]
MSRATDGQGYVVPKPGITPYKGDEIVAYTSESATPFEHVRRLGAGRFGEVTMVRGKKNGQAYACKTIKTGEKRANQLRQDLLDEFQKVRRMVASRYVVRAVSAFVIPRKGTFHLILEPVALGGDLDSFLKRYRGASPEESPNLGHSPTSRAWAEFHVDPMRTLFDSFWGLASGLHSLHQNNMRHRDIKPANCLIHDGRVLLSDFGFARLYEGAEKYAMESSGDPGIKNYRYRAPEVVQHQHRGKETDVFSLGCTYVEIFASLLGDQSRVDPWPEERKMRLERLRRLKQEHTPEYKRLQGSRVNIKFYCEAIGDVSKGLLTPMDTKIKYAGSFLKLAEVIGAMLLANPRRRITTEQLITRSFLVDLRSLQSWWA